MGAMPQRNIKRTHHAEPNSSGKVRKFENFKFAMGIGANWIDQDTGITYHIQEYQEKLKDPTIPKEQKPTKIRMSKNGKDIGYADEWDVKEKMRDPEPDPRYLP